MFCVLAIRVLQLVWSLSLHPSPPIGFFLYSALGLYDNVLYVWFPFVFVRELLSPSHQ